MGKVLSFNDFIGESKKTVRAHIQKEVSSAIGEVAWQGLFVGNYLTETEKTHLRSLNLQNTDNLLDESLLRSIRDGLNQIKDSKIGAAIVAKLDHVVHKASSFAQYISRMWTNAYDKLLGYFVKKYDGVKKEVISALTTGKELAKLDYTSMKDELAHLKETISWWLKNFVKTINDAIVNAFSKKLIAECLNVGTDILERLNSFTPEKLFEEDEKGMFGFLNKVTSAIEKMPPFNLLAHVKHIAESGSKKFLTKFSDVTKEFGGPGVYEFVAVSAVAGFFIEYFVKHLAIGGAEEVLSSEAILRFLPMAGSLLTVIEIVALVVALVDTLDTIVEIEKGKTKTNGV